MKRRRKIGGPSLAAVPLRWGWLLRSQPQLRSTAAREGKGSRGTELTDGITFKNEELLIKNKSQRVTPLLAQRITRTGNSYFWRTAGSLKLGPSGSKQFQILCQPASVRPKSPRRCSSEPAACRTGSVRS